MNPNENNIQTYLMRMNELGLEPNFFTSQAYLEKAGAILYTDSASLWLVADSTPILQPIPHNGGYKACPVPFYWADFNNSQPFPDMVPEFLDWEYIFDPKQFTSMKGGEWATFRKNTRKWPNRTPGWKYKDKPPVYEYEWWDLLDEWIEAKANEIEDAEILVKFLEDPLNNFHRKYLYNSHYELMGINVWDWNETYINYRFCIVRRNRPFLDEFMRYLFYTDPMVRAAKKKVNDGGSLGSVGLERFKDKLNPIRKRAVNSWKKIDKELRT